LARKKRIKKTFGNTTEKEMSAGIEPAQNHYILKKGGGHQSNNLILPSLTMH